jgi:hypothetical protein
VLARILDQQFFNSKGGEPEARRLSAYLLNEPDWSNLPTRCMLNMFYSELPQVDIEIPLPMAEARTDVRQLERLFLSNIRRIVDFGAGDLEAPETLFEARFQLDRKLASQSLTGCLDLRDYGRCSTQEQYINRLRESLSACEQ